MDIKKVAEIVMREPFVPFEIKLQDGETITIRKPLRALVTQHRLLLGIDEDPRTGVSSRTRRLTLHEIASIGAVNTNGRRNRGK